MLLLKILLSVPAAITKGMNVKLMLLPKSCELKIILQFKKLNLFATALLFCTRITSSQMFCKSLVVMFLNSPVIQNLLMCFSGIL